MPMIIPENYNFLVTEADCTISICGHSLMLKVLEDIPDATFKVACYLIDHSIFPQILCDLKYNARTARN